MKMYAIVVAAGAGTRMQSATPKQFLLLQNKPVYAYSVNKFLQACPDIEVILVLPPACYLPEEELLAHIEKPAQVKMVIGGHTRFESVKNGLAAIDDQGIVFIHDSVRPFITPEFIHQLRNAAEQNGNAVPCTEITDSLRIVTGIKNRGIPREQFKAIQTPQVFQCAQIKKAYLQEFNESFTDDASVLEAAGHPIHLTKGLAENIKITTPVDWQYAELILKDLTISEA